MQLAHITSDSSRARARRERGRVTGRAGQGLEAQLRAERARSQEFRELADQMRKVMPDVRRLIDREREGTGSRMGPRPRRRGGNLKR